MTSIVDPGGSSGLMRFQISAAVEFVATPEQEMIPTLAHTPAEALQDVPKRGANVDVPR
ncbi:MAG: hypothetical protein ACWA49_04190 [Ruegeria sp.]